MHQYFATSNNKSTLNLVQKVFFLWAGEKSTFSFDFMFIEAVLWSCLVPTKIKNRFFSNSHNFTTRNRTLS